MSTNRDRHRPADARVVDPRRLPVERAPAPEWVARVPRRPTAVDGRDVGLRGEHPATGVNGWVGEPIGSDDVGLVARYGGGATPSRPPSDWLTPLAGGDRPPRAGTDEPEPDDELDYNDYFDDDDDFDVDTSATRNAIEWAVVLVGAVLVALLLRATLFQAFWIPSESMETTLVIDDRVLVNKMSYRLHEVRRGDVVVFVRPDDEPGEIRDLIKRVIAVGGETIEARDNTIYINDQRLIEPYLDEGVETADFGPVVVAEGEVFVLGDNRSQSYDSRLFGGVDEDRVVGRAFVLFWPLNRIGSL